MEFIQFQHFVAAVQSGSMISAAKNLYVSRQTVSASISRLEDEVGFLLLVRNKNGVTLTPDGELFYKRISKLLDDYSKLSKDMEQHGRQYSLPLRIGFDSGIEAALIDIFENWRSSQSKYKVVFSFHYGNESTLLLEEGSLDMVFTGMPNVHGNFNSEEVLRRPLYLAVHEDHPLSEKIEVYYEDLVGEPIIMARLGYDQYEYSGEKWMPFNPQKFNYIYTDDPIFLFSALCENKGIMICGKGQPLLSLNNVRLIPFAPELGYCLPFFLRTSNEILKIRAYDDVVRNLPLYLKKELK